MVRRYNFTLHFFLILISLLFTPYSSNVMLEGCPNSQKLVPDVLRYILQKMHLHQGSHIILIRKINSGSGGSLFSYLTIFTERGMHMCMFLLSLSFSHLSLSFTHSHKAPLEISKGKMQDFRWNLGYLWRSRTAGSESSWVFKKWFPIPTATSWLLRVMFPSVQYGVLIHVMLTLCGFT